MPSYQSAGSGWKLFVLALFLIAARPYEDTQKRFRLEVEPGWSLTPQFGDTRGMIFEKKLPVRQGGGAALLIVRADPSGGRSIDTYISEVESAFAAMPGYGADGKDTTRVGGRIAQRRRYHTKGRRLTSHFLEANGYFYLVHFEAPRVAESKLRPAVSRMIGSFRTGRAQAASPVAAPPTARLAPTAPIGRWKSSSGIVLSLDEDGVYVLADVEGTYRVDGSSLVLSRPGGGRNSFTFEHDPDGGRLVLSSPDLAAPLVYRRADKPRPAKAKRLIGKWRAVGVDPVFELKIDTDGGFVLGPYSGKWTVKGSALRLAKSATEFITYEFRFAKKKLVLSGGDLDQPVRFKRLK